MDSDEMHTIWVCLGMFTVACLIVIAVAWIAGTGGVLPGFQAAPNPNRVNLDTFWLTFWATLLASVIVALGAGVALFLWQDSIAQRRTRAEAFREVATLREELRFELD
jgi:hypothetical protein